MFIVLVEQPHHPRSRLNEIQSKYEKPSIIQTDSVTAIQNIKTKPIFNDKYLVIFRSAYVFKQVYATLNLDIIQPLILCSSKRVAEEDFIFLLSKRNLPYTVIENRLTREDANNLIAENTRGITLDAKQYRKLISLTGLSSTRLLQAITFLNNTSWDISNMTKSLHFSPYISPTAIVDILLGKAKNKKQFRQVTNYLLDFQRGYNSYIKPAILSELGLYIKVYQDILMGKVSSSSPLEYIEETQGLTPSSYLHILTLYKQVSIYSLMKLEEYVADTYNVLSLIPLLTFG